METLERFVLAFRGRGDIYGSSRGFCKHEALTSDVYTRHLTSARRDDWIGVYCMVNTYCSWGCIDIDGKDFPNENCVGVGCAVTHPHRACMEHNLDWDWDRMLTLTRNLQEVLAVKNIHAHPERTKNGYHLWVFPDTPLVAAKSMRRALMAACKVLDYNPKEVNPKAEGPRPGTKGYGNFVRLPYGGALSDIESFEGKKERVFFDMDGKELSVVEALDRIDAFRTSTEALETVAALYTPPPPPLHEIDYDAGLDVLNVLKLCDGKTYTIWKDGPLPGSDRSSTLVRLTHLCLERGLDATQAYAVVNSADKRWGKYNDQGRPEELAHIIETAAAQHHS